MFFVMAIRLNESESQVKNVYIPSHWCLGLNMESIYTNGINKNTDFKIFYSRNRSKLPNFDLPIRTTFSSEDACYIARYRSCKSKSILYV